jgi:hypothetical protein
MTGTYDYRTTDAKVRHARLVKIVEAQTGPMDDHGNGKKRDDHIIVPHLNYETPIPWDHLVNGLGVWLTRKTTTLMRRVVYRAKEYNWHVLETGRYAFNLQKYDEQDQDIQEMDNNNKTKKLSTSLVYTMPRETVESFLNPMEQAAVGMRLNGYPEGGRSSLASEDQLAKPRMYSFKFVSDAPYETLPIPHFDPPVNGEGEDDEEDEEDEDGVASGGEYTARTDDSFATTATGMTGMTQFTDMSGVTMASGSTGMGEEEEAEDEEEEEDSESGSDEDEDDEEELK